MDATVEIGKALKLIAEAWAECHDLEQAGKLSQASDVLREVLPQVAQSTIATEFIVAVRAETNVLAEAAGLEPDMPVMETLREIGAVLAAGRRVPVLMTLREAD